PVTGVWAESTLIRSRNEPPPGSVESCGATVTMQPEPIWHGPTYLTGTDTGGLAPAPLTTTVSTPAYRTAPSLERMPWSVTWNGCAFPLTRTRPVSVASPAASTGTVVSTTAPGSRAGTPTLEMGTTTTWSWSRSSSRTVPEPTPISGTIDTLGP